ncbi:CHASE2 domain-containing protein [Desulfobacterales bacterium HSG16]|nr:CHASE2 domain-containing protein [Desulfobacterales bacterium HSG16]
MNTNNFFRHKPIFLLLTGAFIFAHACFFIMPDMFETWNEKAIDRLFLFRAKTESLGPRYDSTIVHVDIDDTSIRELKTYYLHRIHFAESVANLSEMKVRAQLYDFIFAAPGSSKEDTELIQAVSKAPNVYFGLAFDISEEKNETVKFPDRTKPEAPSYLDRTKWHVKISGDPDGFHTVKDALMTFNDLAEVSQGLGFLNVKPDSDGVFRRIPLLVVYNDAFYPSLAFRAVCHYLDVEPENIFVYPGRKIVLKNVKHPAKSQTRDIEIPLDCNNNLRINFVGGWGKMLHYHFADILSASKSRDAMELWQEELEGKLVMISEVSTGASDMGPVPTDTNFPLSGLHSNAVNTILTESFLKDFSGIEMLLVELVLIFLILIFSVRFSSLPG